MPRLVTFVLTALLVVACGGGAPGDGGAQASAPGAAPVGNGDFPAGSSVLFGTAYDPATLAVAGKATKVKQGTPMVAVGRTLAPTDPAGVTVQVGAGGSAKAPRPVTASDNPESAVLFAFDLTGDNLGPGTWIVSFLSPNNRILASGYLTVEP